MRIRVAAVLLVAVAVVTACGDEDDGEDASPARALPPPGALVSKVPRLAEGTTHADATFVGASENGPYVALVRQGANALAYVCDGNQLGDWFGGTVDGDRVTARSAKGTELVVSGTDALEGAVTLAGGGSHDVTLRPASGDAGLYRQESDIGGKLGWIILPDGSKRGVTESSGKTVGTASTSSGETTVSGSGGGGTPATTTTTSKATTFGKKVYSPIFKTTYSSCSQLDGDIRDTLVLYGVSTLEQCGQNTDSSGGCKQFVPEFQRIANGLGCMLNPFQTYQ